MTTINNIAGSAEGVSAAANNNNIFSEIIVKVGIICPDHLKFNLTKYGRVDLGDGMKLVYVPTNDSILRVYLPDGNWFNVVKNHSVGSRCNWKYITEQVKHIVCRHYNVPDPENFPTFNDWANDLYEYGFCNSDKRMEKIWAKNRENNKEWDALVQQTEAMQDIVASYQSEFDGYMEDLEMVAESYDHIETKIESFAAKKIVEKMAKVSMDCYTALEEYNGCSMGWDDGWHIDTTALGRWYRVNDWLDDDDMEHLIDALDYMCGIEWDMPLADVYTMRELIYDGNMASLPMNMPLYLDDEIRDFISTYYHYMYCA